MRADDGWTGKGFLPVEVSTVMVWPKANDETVVQVFNGVRLGSESAGLYRCTD
jgi:hypothetical protein